MDVPARAEARIDLRAIRDNVALLADRAAPAGVMAVVKADGYGHGLLPAARAALAGGATWLGVAHVEEAVALRDAGLDAPRILSWLAAPGEDYAGALQRDVDLSAYATWQVDEIAAAARGRGRPARLHLEADTGMGRGGATSDAWGALVDAALRAQAAGEVEIVGLWSHLACADEPDHPSNDAQVAAFTDAIAYARGQGVRPDVCHLANSAATLTRADARFDLVRAGIATYGLSPLGSATPSDALGLTPAMTLRARLALVKDVAAGQGVSYGHRYVTATATRLGVVPLGYGDGIHRAATNAGPLWIAGRRRTVAGTVSMDQLCVDLGTDHVEAGDEVVVFGTGRRGEPTAQDWADVLGTISYEIVTRLGPRITRSYVGSEALA